jgi:hypothetical protein
MNNHVGNLTNYSLQANALQTDSNFATENHPKKNSTSILENRQVHSLKADESALSWNLFKVGGVVLGILGVGLLGYFALQGKENKPSGKNLVCPLEENPSNLNGNCPDLGFAVHRVVSQNSKTLTVSPKTQPQQDDPLIKEFDRLLTTGHGRDAVNLATSCIDKTDKPCRSLLEESFTKLLKKHPFLGQLFATSCIGKEDPVCKSTVKEAFPKLLEQEDCRALDFARACVGKEDPICQSIVREASHKLIEKHTGLGLEFALSCIGKEDAACQSVVEGALPLLLEKNIEKAHYFVQACMGKVDKACQSVIQNAPNILLQKNPDLTPSLVNLRTI